VIHRAKLICLLDIDRVPLPIDVSTPVHFSWSVIVPFGAGGLLFRVPGRYPWAPRGPHSWKGPYAYVCATYVCARLCVIYAHVSISARDVDWIFY